MRFLSISAKHNHSLHIGLLYFLLLFAYTGFGQDTINHRIQFNLYGELYYGIDNYRSPIHERPGFLYNHKRTEEVSINLAFLRIKYNGNRARLNLALMTGTYVTYNLATEPAWAKNIMEGYAGYRLSASHNLWLDAGIFNSHIGFESPVGRDGWTLTRSLIAENHPYYESGVRLNYTNRNETLNLSFYALNGWQKIQRLNDNHQPAVGLHFNYKPHEKWILNYSNFLGSDKPDSLHSFRHYHNFYILHQLHPRLSLLGEFVAGNDKYNSTDYGFWYAASIYIKSKLSSNLHMTVRGEYYFDKNQIIIALPDAEKSVITGYSLNFDYTLTDELLFRIEARSLAGKNGPLTEDKSRIFNYTAALIFHL